MGGHDTLLRGKVRNIRYLCAECNELRAACGHCIGAVACIRAIAERRGIPVWYALRLSGIRHVSGQEK